MYDAPPWRVGRARGLALEQRAGGGGGRKTRTHRYLVASALRDAPATRETHDVLPHLSSVLRTGCGQSDVARWSCRSHPGAGSVAEQMRPPFPSSPGRGGVDPGGHSSAPGPSSHAFTQLTVTTAREWRTRPWKPSGPKSLAAAPAGSLHVSRLKGKDTRRALIAGVMPERETGPVRMVGQPEHLCKIGPRLAAGLEGRGWRPP